MFADILRSAGALMPPDSMRAVAEGVAGRAMPDGGFAGRGAGSDLYYAPFALAVLDALCPGRMPEAVRPYLLRQPQQRALDWVHRCSLAQCWLLLGDLGRAEALAGPLREDVGRRSVQDRFLAGLVLTGLGRRPPPVPPARPPIRAVPEAAALLTLEAWNRLPPSAEALAWVEGGVDPAGGLRAGPRVAQPDVLSLATGLIGLLAHGRLRPDAEVVRHVAFVSGCRRPTGCFAAAPSDPDPAGDVEYTFYSLAALGALVSPALQGARPLSERR